MITREYKNSIIKFTVYILIIFLLLFGIVKIIPNVEETDREISKSNSNSSLIEFSDDNTSVHVEYPRFDSDDVNLIITNMIYSYIREFKKNENKKVLDITYELYKIKDYVNITFHIENTLNNIKNKNLLIDLKNNELSSITSLYDEEYLKNEINNKVFYNYSKDIYDKVKDEDINNYTYILDDDKLSVYFNNIDFDNIDYIPYINIPFDEETTYIVDNMDSDKYIAFTYDDGPSEYTRDLLNTLENNNSSATFFMIGSKMEEDKEIVYDISNSNSEIGSHTYSHKDLTSLDINELNEELNKPKDIYNEITNKSLSYLRPPYGKYDDSIKNSNYRLILWNIDPKDWLVRDSETIYNNVINNACDGCIVLMHDIYPESIDATKKLIPALKEKGYSVVSISKLIEIKNYNYTEPIDIIK